MKIGEIVKQHRLNKNITQEKLAEHLNISIPAISKWERGETLPDITLLIPIASFFEISVDELIGYNVEKNKIKIQYYLDEHKKMLDLLKYKEAKDIIYQSYKEFPNDFRIMHHYLNYLFYDENNDATNEEIIKLCEKIKEECTIDFIRDGALSILAKVYFRSGKEKQAKEIIKNFPHIYGCVQNIEFEKLYPKGSEDWWYYVNYNLFDLSYLAISKVEKIINQLDLPLDEKVKKLKNLGEHLINIKDDFGYELLNFHIISVYHTITNLYVKDNAEDNALSYLEITLKYAKEFDDFMKSNKKVNNAPPKFKDDVIINWGSSEINNQITRYIIAFDNSSLYNNLRNNPKYKDIINKYRLYMN